MTTEHTLPQEVDTTVTTTETQLDDLQGRLQSWIRNRLEAPDAVVDGLQWPSGTGISSLSVLFTVEWTTGGEQHRADLVVRLAPEPTALPVFPSYDLARQASVMTVVADHGVIPVPRIRWVENSPEYLGRPFLVMDRMDGVVPSDNPPYVFAGWLMESDPDQLARLQQDSVDVLARIHATPNPARALPDLADAGSSDALRRHVNAERDYYEWTVREGGVRVPLLEDGFAWLEEHWPEQTSPDVLCWGDARIGNIIYRDHAPVAVVDWELATIGPPELDVAWFIFFHAMFQDLAEQFDQPGLPNFLRREDVVRRYEETSGTALRDLDFFLVYAAVRHGTIMARIKRRSEHFGDSLPPEHPNEYVLHHRTLAALLEDRYTWERA